MWQASRRWCRASARTLRPTSSTCALLARSVSPSRGWSGTLPLSSISSTHWWALCPSLQLVDKPLKKIIQNNDNRRKLGFISLSILFLSNQTLLFPSSALPESLASAFCLGEYAECDSHAVDGAGGGEGTRSGSDTEGEQKKIQKENNNPLCC